MQEPIETVIVRVKQKFWSVGGLNPAQIEIEYDRVVNLIKKQKNVAYKLTPLGISIKNDTEQIFITCR